MAWNRYCSSSYALSRTTFAAGSRSTSLRHRSSPLVPFSRMSHRTMSGFSVAASFWAVSASSAWPTTRTRPRNRPRMVASPCSTISWSSTSTTRSGPILLGYVRACPATGEISPAYPPRAGEGSRSRAGLRLRLTERAPRGEAGDRVPHKLFRMQRADHAGRAAARPVMLAIAGDSAAGKTTITRGLVEALGADRCTAVCADDYHRYDRSERRDKPFTALHPDCNYVQIMQQHLQLLAMGQPALKPVYDHRTGQLTRPVLVEPPGFVIVEGMLPLHTKLARAAFDATVYLDPPEEIRRNWKVRRDTAERGYTAEAVRAGLD